MFNYWINYEKEKMLLKLLIKWYLHQFKQKQTLKHKYEKWLKVPLLILSFLKQDLKRNIDSNHKKDVKKFF